MEDDKLLLEEYRRFDEAFWKNEEAGEHRVTFFITLTTAILAAVVAFRTRDVGTTDGEVSLITSAGLVGLILFGLVTFLRMLQRDRVTDEYKGILRYLREQLRQRADGLDEYALPFASRRHWLLRGGLAVTVAVLNGFLLAVLTAVLIQGDLQWVWALASGMTLFVAQAIGIRARKTETRQTQAFRAGVGAVILNADGKVLFFERRDIPGTWQMPQGGLKMSVSET